MAEGLLCAKLHAAVRRFLQRATFVLLCNLLLAATSHQSRAEVRRFLQWATFVLLGNPLLTATNHQSPAAVRRFLQRATFVLLGNLLLAATNHQSPVHQSPNSPIMPQKPFRYHLPILPCYPKEIQTIMQIRNPKSELIFTSNK